jgi:SAM-dependent methyltransferase
MTTGAKQPPATMPTTLDEIRATVQARYGATAKAVADGAGAATCCAPANAADGAGESSGCCGSSGIAGETWDPITSDLYDAGQTAGLPAEALLASLGCGNPTALAELAEGETVLDLGSGGGIDVLLSARRVGPTGKAYGLDMTDEMLALALENKQKAGATNVEFLKGHIESIPLPSNTVDVIISNCVINLAADKPAVFREIARVLKPGGRMGVTDIVAEDRLTAAERGERGSYTGCIAGALSFSEFEAGLAAVGLVDVSLTPTHEVADGMVSAIVRATKPVDAPPAVDLVARRSELPLADGGCCGGGGCC